MNENNVAVEPIPEHFQTLDEAAEFWDTHDLGDYWELTEEVDFEVNLEKRTVFVAVDSTLAERVANEARKRGLNTETLINLWLSEKAQEVAI